MAKRATTEQRKPSHPWSYSTGEWGGNRVRVYDRGKKGIYADFYEETPTGLQRRRLALGTTDREAAKMKADQLALEFRTQAKAKRSVVTLRSLFDNYLTSMTPSKGARSQAYDRATLPMMLRFFGEHRQPKTLSILDWNRYISERRRGAIRPTGAKDRTLKPVRNRAIERDLRLLLAVLNFGCLATDGQGLPFLDRNPLKGLPVPKEESPRRPTLTADEYATLLQVAPKVHPLFRLLLILARETGHRGSSLRQLRWSDVNLDQKRVQWRAENDKIHFEHVTPLTDEAVRALQAHRRAIAVIGDGWIFPAPRRPDHPCSRNQLQQWWARAATLAKLPDVPGRGLHAVRRQFASELKHLNLKDLSALGGWKNSATLLACYITADEETQREALASRKPFRSVAQG